MRTYVLCPRCRQGARLLKNGTMSQHRTENHAIGQLRGGRIRERCPYSGVTRSEAEAGITALRRLVNQRKQAKEQHA